MRFFKNLLRSRKGAAMVEYALLVAGVALIGAAAVSVMGNKTGDMFAAIATVLPGAQTEDNNTIQVGEIIETDLNAAGAITLQTEQMNDGAARLGENVGLSAASADDFGTLVVEPARSTEDDAD